MSKAEFLFKVADRPLLFAEHLEYVLHLDRDTARTLCEDGDSALHRLVRSSSAGTLDYAHFLLKYKILVMIGTPVEVRNDDGETAFLLAIKKGMPCCTVFLDLNRSVINVPDFKGATPICAAAAKKDRPLIRNLLRLGARDQPQCKSPLTQLMETPYCAVRRDILEDLLTVFDPRLADATDHDKHPKLLDRAADLKELNVLLKAGAIMHQCNETSCANYPLSEINPKEHHILTMSKTQCPRFGRHWQNLQGLAASVIRKGGLFDQLPSPLALRVRLGYM